MTTIIVRHRVRDFGAWKPLFDEHEPVRRAHRLVGHQLYRGLDDPNDITIVFAAEDLERAKEFATSEDLRSVMERAGVEGPPEIWYGEEIEEKRYSESPAETPERVSAST